MKEKDAWDIYYCLRHFPGGLDALAKEFRPHLSHGLVTEGLSKIGQAFASAQASGPTWVASFEDIRDAEERARVMRDAFERVRRLLDLLGIP
jgi:hypothetical protein